ncbi:DUF302 domain-containing protein [Rhizobium sp. P28RR-XV]|uniref:DUF302 domain-containing protein n=1 Tax=Rhizobium sp. P28RR-XV TaxID=2726737 RepID=UPI001456BCA6|nr:DUF302 domain-containing protein [Rhizobium sp. P28RR-XV]NLR86146.1 DUF302 domain-containing protein [Rhizobium sp. P28RR-XV]
MTYTLDRTFKRTSFGDALDRTKATLSKHGFGILTEIDVKATMKRKIGVDISDYVILGACNPGMAFEAIKLEPKIGAMLPCNVIVRSINNSDVMVSAIDPTIATQPIDNEVLQTLAQTVRSMLREALAGA